ncbi:GNAT family N-acetyltransferase [Varunaivibrio sulfuroxidans]|uniref:Acetyltransferase (GNAT) family protein n=1 Tax=Varunaivibrio sulfuroxidans TaxID=1773489 RepID=A0A4R3JFY2_9PROT|nr:GNAT family N-acetyltransferase [Varunaivibrio sulfuroxidans]TCS64106.1 acetyltransferase (GNAT) family protein [Varunaivibrio sulfuroxidans]WES31445.1 GNAT family N-acetyltransferase [Varunaivibrio sulfuroxidans]
MPDHFKKDDKIESTITYLEMTKRPLSPTPRPSNTAPGERLSLMRALRPTVSFYRFLYGTVGAPWLWYERLLLDDHTLARTIQNDDVEIYVLYLGGVPAGYSELDARDPQDIELAYFGLMPEFIGRGLGRFFLRWTIDQAWTHAPRRFWVHTCTQDHPSAVGLYQKEGFVPYDQKRIVIEDPRQIIAAGRGAVATPHTPDNDVS